jgi:hypothetical protein
MAAQQSGDASLLDTLPALLASMKHVDAKLAEVSARVSQLLADADAGDARQRRVVADFEQHLDEYYYADPPRLAS